ncbi:O-antigen ligase family protein [Thiothrix subterranea]|uniref:O-antigen ligase family protein n=1 Tax=Thiothrix subterranea TaxID=2735563 RepID=A0AA51MNV3_9GAMM|nr:O-antigen ligase family protein [Thiothrix subterranea]WML87588.1 O-antigen ligase family protein [Thiothrix subterranea]
MNNVYLAGLPVRSFLILLAGGLVFLLDNSVATRLRPVNLIYVLLAILGLVVSLANNVGVGGIVRGEMRLLQSYLLIMVSYFILEQHGFRTLALVILGLALPSALIGIMQGFGVHIAWDFHAMLQEMQNKEISDEMRTQMNEVLDRPPGLTLYAIPQTYMLLSAMAINLYLIIKNPAEQHIQWLGLWVCAVLAGGIFASETRSAMGAALVMPGLIYLLLFPARVIPMAGLAMLLGGIAYLLMSGSADVDSRLVNLDDASAAGRSTLYKYGIELFLQKPFGYGFDFNTVEYAVEYFVNERNIFNYELLEKAQYIVPVHNSILNLMHTYGFAGLLLLGYYLYRLVKGSWYRMVFIVATLVNSLFHNAGILSNDLFMDIVIAVMLYEISQQQSAA